MKALILGVGRSGNAAKLFLEHHGWDVHICEHLPEQLDFDLAILSPGIPLFDDRCQRIIASNIELIGELELGLRFLDRPAVGVTGTNGKTTTTELIAYLTGGVACGNNGYALTKALLESEKNVPLVIEMSSFQLETVKTRCLDGAVILNVTPDHLDRYKNFDSYRAAKERIALCLKEGAPLYRSIDTYEAAELLSGILGRVRSKEGFTPPAHRLEFVAKIGGVRFINDSKATNVESVLHALKKETHNVILLAGGLDKGGDFTKWVAFAPKVKKILVFGKAQELIAKALKSHFTIERVENLEVATKKAFKEARDGDTILLSPGCASYDQFRDFEERGEKYKTFVWECKNES
ncbi:MAG: hypothetical protein KDK44_03585 [Chlamydiia bacterium]|nr:hypothetical protein [Chlamydiia bacterium]MCP5510083.1 hypothetical protein [Chlamydiales bacterium]